MGSATIEHAPRAVEHGDALLEDVFEFSLRVVHENGSRLERSGAEALGLFRRCLAWSPSCHKVPGSQKVALSLGISTLRRIRPRSDCVPGGPGLVGRAPGDR